MNDPATRLVIAYCFTPFVDTSGTVAAKRVCLLGEPVDVIQNDMSSLRKSDSGLDAIAGSMVRRRAMLDTVTRFSSWISISEWCVAGMAQVEKWVGKTSTVQDEPGSSQDRPPWTSMYSRSHFIASHFLAALIKSRYPHLRWEAEFSDPCSRDATGELRYAPVGDGELLENFRSILHESGANAPESDNAFEWAEFLVYALADEIIFTNANQATYMLGYCADQDLAARGRAATAAVHHPMLPQRFYSMAPVSVSLDPDRIHIGYFGNFYGKQSPQAAVEGISFLPMDLRQRLQLHIFTAPTEPLEKIVDDLDVADCVNVQPFLPFLQFLATAGKMDILLVVDYPLPKDTAINPFLLSKWGDYKGTGQPIWGILEESSVLSATEDPALMYRTPVGHVTAAAQLLSRLARDASLRTKDLATATAG
ncbi:MAG: hypothetical protein WA991_09580 [Ornithinimicrobium sp.]